ncbi:MAG TPA: asparagine synthase (glutamine-hydrolyzing) [Gemmataceae bacterium]|nr:asparagine synthase (glutamine-hydrolyzing) [Gemmataceae bacterium]
MCGIAGILDLTGRKAAPPDVVRRMASAIVRRGPDEDGFLDQQNVCLGNRRLSIVGLKDGRQPIGNEDGSVQVVFNGELFNYPEQRRELEARGHRFARHTDTELLPHMWEEHGEAMWEKLRGQFAVALWDKRQERLILARDRFGICPLFWTIQRPTHGEFAGGNWLLFASETKALLASGLVEARPDVRGINHIFTFFATPGPVTCFEGVQMLLPGRYLDLHVGDESEPREKTFYEFDFPDRGHEIRHADPKRLTDEFEQVFTKSVSQKLRADVPVVSYLSGGVDSSIVVALAKQVMGRPIPTFTIGIGGDPKLNEESEATIVARHVGATDRVIVKCGHAELLATYPELVRAAEVPVVDTACAALLLLAKAVREKGYKVTITGEGADEWLAGYPWFKVQRLRAAIDLVPGLKLSRWMQRAFLTVTGVPMYSEKIIQEREDILGGPNAWLNVWGLMTLSKLRFFRPEMWERLKDHNPFLDLQLNRERMAKWHPFHRSLLMGARVMLPGLLLSSKGDRVAMNSSVEARYPFLDEEVFAFLAQLHPRWKLRGLFRDKYILRLLAQRYLPKEIAWRRKAMFRAPMDSFHGLEKRQPGGEWVEPLLSEEALNHTGYFDAAAVTKWRRDFRRFRPGSIARTSLEMGLAGVTATQLWHHTYIEEIADTSASPHAARGVAQRT